jgi:serine/threonine-protein kinase
MTDERWRQVRDVFDAALQRAPDERQSYIIEVCGNNEELLREVESLFASLDQSSEFLETPAVAHVAEMIELPPRSLAPGTRFGHYEITRQIGLGGMGEVYLAKDLKLDRSVAIKILNRLFSQDESNLQRFVREAKAASALNHPNILVIHEVGESNGTHYIVSEFIEGRTLREVLAERQLSLREVLDTSIQIANALSSAHGAHLLHRDIKPENLMIRPDGYVKVLDFGLAKLMQSRGEPESSGLAEGDPRIDLLSGLQLPPSASTPGVIMGTIGYMSPEQAKGELVDERTDIFSLGVVLYEMLAGRTPFADQSRAETFANLINAEPAPLSASNAPEELQHIVAKMLRKIKDERYLTMKDVLTDLKDLKENLSLENKLERSPSYVSQKTTSILQATSGDANKQTAETQHGFFLTVRRLKPVSAFVLGTLLVGVTAIFYYSLYSPKTASSADSRRSIAVLPLKPINTANRDEIYEIGIADSLIHKINSMKSIMARPLSATRKYADIAQDPLAAGREQQVDYVLASNYQLTGGKIRITAQLFNVASGQVEETYQSEKDAGDVFAMQDAIAGEVGNKLLARFATTSTSPTAKRGTMSKDAYRLYLQGMYLYDRRTVADAQQAVGLLEQSIQFDPNFARAWSLKAHAHRSLGNFGGDTHEEYKRSIEAINRALALDENLADAHSALCENKFFYEWDFDGAERECKRAIELDAISARAHDIYSRFLYSRGRFDEAIAESETAIDLEPTALFIQRNYGISLFYARRYTEAVNQFKRVSEIDPNFVATYAWLVPALNVQGNKEEGFEWFMKWQAVLKADQETLQGYKTAYQTSGWRGVGRERVKRFDERKIRSYFLEACLTVLTGDKDKAFEYLEKSYQRREWGMSSLLVDPSLDALRSDPRFDDLIRRVQLK